MAAGCHPGLGSGMAEGLEFGLRHGRVGSGISAGSAACRSCRHFSTWRRGEHLGLKVEGFGSPESRFKIQ